MKVLMVADARSIHTRRWAVSLRSAGVEIVLFSLFPEDGSYYAEHGVRLVCYDLFTYKKIRNSLAAKLIGQCKHFSAVRKLKKLIAKEKPDIVHAHYATSFALVAAMSGFHPLIVSVWGSDVYEFPRLSATNAKSVRYSLAKADSVLSTSEAMAVETGKYTDKKIHITPFGVDISLFKLMPMKKDAEFVVGTVKTLSNKYGIDILIKAFKGLCEANPDSSLRLVIIGEGPRRKEYEKLAENLGIADRTNFLGHIANERLPYYYNSFTVAAFLSREESFGVVAVEANACACPVIVSDADGLKEIVEKTAGGLIVPREDVEETQKALQKILDRPRYGQLLGFLGRKGVHMEYCWTVSVLKVLEIYAEYCPDKMAPIIRHWKKVMEEENSARPSTRSSSKKKSGK